MLIHENNLFMHGHEAVEAVRVQGRPRLGWTDGVKVTLGNRGMTVEAVRQCAKDRK